MSFGSRHVSAAAPTVVVSDPDCLPASAAQAAHTPKGTTDVGTEGKEEVSNGTTIGDGDGGDENNGKVSGERTFQALKAMVEEARYVRMIRLTL